MTSATPRTRRRAPALLCVLALLAALPLAATAQDKTAERAARRAQLQMQSLQQQVQDAQAAQARADADKAEADKRLAAQAQEIPRTQAVARKTADALKASEAARAELQARFDALQKQSAEQKRHDDAALAQKISELDFVVHAWDAQHAQLQATYDNEIAQMGVCTDKNDRLVKLGAELLERYRNKGLAQVAGQRDPLLGIGQVQMFNYVQDTRDRIDAERLTPTPAGRKPLP
jgi:septal ring factor EnvC (AmiA/AmiB activator)